MKNLKKKIWVIGLFLVVATAVSFISIQKRAGWML